VTDPRLERWLEALVATPGVTSVRAPAEARRVHLEESLRLAAAVRDAAGPLVDVGSGGGAPGLPLAAALPDLEVTLLEANRRKCDFLERVAADFPNVRVVWGRAEEQPLEQYGVAVAKALAAPPVAAELLLPLVREGGRALVLHGPSGDVDAVRTAARRLNAEAADAGAYYVLRKTGPTPAGFPRRPGIAKKRPLA
jgi:16S rRNA (guanine527-N7)-methyltransferase